MAHVIEKLSRDSDDWVDGKFRLAKKPTHDIDQYSSEYFYRSKWLSTLHVIHEPSGPHQRSITLWDTLTYFWFII